MSEVLAIGVLFGLIGALLLRLRRRAPASSQAIATLRPGWAEVRGHARGGGSKLAPISGRIGLGWRVLVEEETGMRGWQTVVELCECSDFEVEDASGSIRVRASDSPITLEVAELRGHGGPFDPPPITVERLIAAAEDPRGVLFHKGFRWREWVLEDGREVSVKARVVDEPGEAGVGYRALSHELVLAGGSARPIIVEE